MKTYMANQATVQRRYVLIDAEGQVLGRLATAVATILRGKNKPEYTPHADIGDFVIVINADKVEVTGDKEHKKIYRRHSGYPGGFKEILYKDMVAKHPEKVIEEAVRGMLPKNSLGRQLYRKLKVYAGPNHPHQAQKPEKIEL